MGRGLILRRKLMQRPSFTDFLIKAEIYAVLAPLSRSYPPSKGRLPTRYSPVRHSTQGRSPFLVRLACVRHAASVHSEPESNSPVTYNYKQPCCFIKPYQSVLFAPTRYLFVKDPCPSGKRRSSLATRSLTVKYFLFFFHPNLRRSLRKGRVNFLTSLSLKGQPFFKVFSEKSKKKVLATTYFPTSGLAVSSAMEVLTSEFGMESGGTPPPWSPGRILRRN